MSIRIGIDAFPFQEKPTGIGKYIMNLVDEISRQIPDAEYFAYSNRTIVLSDYLKDKVVKREFINGINSKIPGKVWLKKISGRHIKKDNLNFYISTSGFFPDLSSGVKKIAVIHDLNYKVVPQTMGRMHLLTHFLFFKKDVRSADFIITNSKGTAERVKHYLNKDANEVINPPISEIYFKRNKIESESVLKKYNINSAYLLFVGNLEPRKNLLNVLNAFVELVEEKKVSDTKLLIVGLKGWRNNHVQHLIDQYTESIQTSGYVEESDLPVIYSNAKVFLFPSLYEGFGIPVREALLCGTSVITSDTPELKEAGEIAESNKMISYINPNKREELKIAILKHLGNDKNDTHSINTKPIQILKLIEFLKNSSR